MKKFTKICSVVLAIAMLLSTVAVFADETTATTTTAASTTLTDIDPGTVVGKAVTELVKLNIINGYDDGTYKPDNTVTRGEMAKIITCFLNIAQFGSDTVNSGFPDVDNVNHWAKKYIKLAADKGIVNGFEDGTFRPDASVTYVQAVKMIVCALNYGQIAQSKQQKDAPWYQGYMTVAAEQGILKSASVNNQEDPASRGIIAILIYNSLEVDVPEIKSDGTVSIGGGGSAISQILQKESVEGVVTAVYQTGLESGTSGLTKRNILVQTKKGEKEYQVDKSVDTYSLLGRKIEAYAEESDNSDVDVLKSITKSNKNETTVVNADMINSVSSSSVTYYPDDNSSKKTIQFASDMDIIYNGKALPSATSDIFKDIKSGNITFVCNNGDGNPEVAFVESYDVYVVNSYDKSGDEVKVYSMYNGGTITIPDKTSTDFIFSMTKDGNDFEASALTKWDVLSVMQSSDKSEGKGVWKAIVTRKKVSGTIKEMEGDEKLTINGKSYSFSYIFKDYEGSKPTFAINTSTTLYLDHEDKIAGANSSGSSSESSTYVAYLINADKENGIDGEGRIQIFGVTGASGEKIYKLASKVSVDGVQIGNSEDVLDALKATSAVANATKFDGSFDTKLELTEYAQLIRYTLNSKGLVDSIDTVVANANVTDDDLVLSLPFPYAENTRSDKKFLYSGAGQFVKENKTSTQVLLNSTTKVIVLPTDVTDTENIKVASYSGTFSTSSYYRIEAYNVSSVDVAKYVITYKTVGAESYTDTTPFVLTKQVSTTSDENGEFDKLEGWTLKGVTTQVQSKNKGLLADYELGEIFTYLDSNNRATETKDVLRIVDGEPVLCYERQEGDANYNRLRPLSAEDAKSERIFMKDNTVRSATNSYNRFYFGTVIGKDGNIIKVNNTLYTDPDGIDMEAESETFTLQINEEKPESSTTKVYLYDKNASKASNKLLQNVSLDNIKTAKELDESDADINEASRVLIYTTTGKAVKTVIIFK